MASAHTNQTPTLGDVDNGAAITTGVRFTVDSDTTITAIRFWVPTTNTGTYTVGLYETTASDGGGSPAGTLLQSASAAAGTLTGGQFNNVAITPQAVVSTKVYTAAVHSSSGRIVASGSVFDEGPISNGGVTLLASGADPNPPGLGTTFNGVFSEGASLTYPVSQFNQTDYFVDVVAGVSVVEGAGLSAATSTDAAAAVVTALAAMSSAGASTGTASGLVRVFGAGLSAAVSAGLITVIADVAGKPVVSFTVARPLVTTSRGAP